MELLGVGPLEFGIILLLVLIVIGPKDMLKTGYKLGAWVRKINAEFQNVSRKIMDDEGVREQIHEIQGEVYDMQKSFHKEVNSINPLVQPVTDNKIAPPEKPAQKETKQVKASSRKPKGTTTEPKKPRKASTSKDQTSLSESPPLDKKAPPGVSKTG